MSIGFIWEKIAQWWRRPPTLMQRRQNGAMYTALIIFFALALAVMAPPLQGYFLEPDF